MINAFLVYLDNIADPPGDVYWPEFEPREIGSAEQSLRDLVIGTGLRRREHFLRCVQLTYLVANSPFVAAITAADSRITYSVEALRELFRTRGAVVTPNGTAPVAELVFGERPGTPDLAVWTFQILTFSAPNGTIRYQDDRNVVLTLPFSFDNGTTSVIELPDDQGIIQLYGPQITPGDRWTVNYQGDIESWIGEVYHRAVSLNPAGVVTSNLLRAFKSAPLAIDKLAAVAAGLGGWRP